jgi:uncharacterized membrane protein
MHIEDRVEIAASTDAVWALTMDVEHWPDLTPTITSIQRLGDEPFGVGSEARIKQPRMPAMRWRVTGFQPGSDFTWETRSPGARTVASHRITPTPDGRSTVTLTINQMGPLSALINPFIGGMTRRYVQMEADGLKRRAESP